MAQMNLANAYLYRIQGERADNLEQSIIFSKQSLQVYSCQAFPERWAMVQNNLAAAYSYRIRGERSDNLEQAIAYFEHLLQEFYTREAFPEQWAMVQINLAAAYLYRIRGERSDNLEQAIVYSEQAFQVYSRQAFPERWAMVQINLAAIYRGRIQGKESDNIEQAIAFSEQALQVCTCEAFPEQWAMVQMNLATAYLSRIRGEKAENLEWSIMLCEQALQVYTCEAFPEKWAMVQHNLAVAYGNRIQGEQVDNLKWAIAAYEKALKIYTPLAFPNDCRQTASSLGSLHFKEQAWLKAARAYIRAFRAAEHLYQNCILLEGKTAEIAEMGNLHYYTACALARCGHLKAATLVLERGRARGLSESLERDQANLEGLKQLNFALYNHYRELTNQIRNLEAQQREYATSGTTAQEKRHLRQNLTPEAHSLQARQLYQSLDAVIKEIRQVEGYADFLEPTNFADIRATVQSDRPLVYLVSAGAGSFALIVTSEAIFDLWLDDHTWDAVGETFTAWFKAYGQYESDPTNRPVWLEGIDQGTYQLWHFLMEPLIQALKAQNFSQAILIPSGLLSFLPLHAAWTDDPKAPTGRRYALDEIHFTYAPNARSLAAAQEIANRTRSDAILAIDEPKYRHEVEPGIYRDLNSLPSSTLEVEAAVSTFQNPKILRHTDATREVVIDILADYNVLHCSCHGGADPQEPLKSGLAMTGDGESAVLTLRDLLDLKLANDDRPGIRLAILSACETGLQGMETIDEVISLPAGLLQSGVAGVVASLWAVSDLSTMLLLSKFYELWRTESKEPPEALRQAQIWLRDSTEVEIAPLLGKRPRNPTNRPFSHPYHWAAFSYTGV